MWAKLKEFFWQSRGVWIAMPSVAGLVILMRLTGLLQSSEWGVYNHYMRWRPQQPVDNRIVIVGIDEADLHGLKESIIPDQILVDLLEKLKAQQPRAIGLDIYRDLPVPPGHQALVEVFKTTPNLVGIQKVAGDMGRETVAPPPVLKAEGQVGANDLIFDADNQVRRALIYLTDNNETIYSFSMHLALLYLDKAGIVPEVRAGTDNWKLGKTVFTPFEANDGGYVRTDAGGYQLLINYRGGSRHFETVSMTDILEERVSPDWGRDRVILIGKVGESFKDLFFTPYSSDLFDLPIPVAGVEIHANLTSQIISAALEGRPLIKTWSEPIEWLWIFFWSGVGATISWQLRYVGGVKTLSLRRWAGFLFAGVSLLSSTYIAFLSGLWLPIVPPLLALTGATVAITAYIARTAVEIRKTFGRYLTDQVVANLLESPSGLQLGGERRKITILTSDLRGFTATCEQLSPEEVIKILNLYLKHMADVVTKYQGTIDEFMGDGILVLFGAPTVRRDDAQRAIACAVEMQLAMSSINEKMQEWELRQLEMGIGINTGEVVVGNIGSEKRAKYGVVGSQVNLTYRIESYTLGGQIFISEPTLQEAGSIVRIDGQRDVLMKGVKQLVTIYEVGGIYGEYNLFLSKEEETFFPLSTAIPIQYKILEGKHIGDAIFKGSLVQLSVKGAQIHSENEVIEGIPPGLSNIKLNLLTPKTQAEASEDIYAKVLEKSAVNGFYINFTAKPPEVAAILNFLYELVKLNFKKKELENSSMLAIKINPFR